MSNYFKKTKKSAWNILDAYKEFENAHKELTTQQKLNNFYNFLNKQEYPELEAWKKNWNSFYNRVSSPRDTSQVTFSNSTIGTLNQNNKRGGKIFVNYGAEEFPRKRRVRHADEEEHVEDDDADNDDGADDDDDVDDDDDIDDADYIDSGSSDNDDAKVYQIDYLVGLGVINYDLNRLDDNNFKALDINNVNFSERYLVYRQAVIDRAESNKSLSKSEQLILNFIMEIDKNKPKPVYLTTNEWSALCDNLDSEYVNTTVSQPIISKLYDFSFEESKLKRDDITATISDKKIQSFLNTINDNYGNTFEIRELEEDTYLQFSLEPLLNILFKNKDGISVDGSSSPLQSSKNSRKKFDSSLLPKKADYCVSIFYNGTKKNIIVNETKSVKSTVKQSNDDDIKLANIMKDALDDLYKNDLGDQVLGMLVQGTRVDFYIMDLKYTSIYRLYKFSTCYIPVDENDFGRVPKLVIGLLTLESHFNSIKDLIDSIAVKKYTRNRLLSPPRTVTNFSEPSFLSPTKHPKA